MREPLPSDGSDMGGNLFKYFFFPVFNKVLASDDHIAIGPFFYFKKPKKITSASIGSEEESDTKISRESRVAEFQNAANETTKVEPSLLLQHDTESIIDQ